MKTIGVVLAGGKSRRFGGNKLLEIIDGGSMISHVLETLAGCVDKVFISVGRENHDLMAHEFGQKIIVDEIPGIGPIGGLYSAFHASGAEWIVLLAGDMPRITSTSIESILASRKDGVNAVVARDASHQAHPLAACYHRSVIPDVQTCIDHRSYAMKALLSRIKRVEYVTLPEADLTNVNHPGDLSAMRGNPPSDR